MKNGKRNTTTLAILILGLTVTGIAAAAAGYGTEDDPLVTASYINDVVRPEISREIEDAAVARRTELLRAVDEKIAAAGGLQSDALVDAVAARAADMVNAGAAKWQVIRVPAGKTLTGQVGCQMLLRLGSASCVSSGATGLIDLSGGTVLGSGGALQANHLYMVTIDGRGFRAGADATVLICGSYTIA